MPTRSQRNKNDKWLQKYFASMNVVSTELGIRKLRKSGNFVCGLVHVT